MINAETAAGKLELITVGRCGVDLYGEQVGGRLEDMASFAKYPGGSPTNTAIGSSRLGLSVGMITRVGGDHFGRFLREELQKEGVDTSGVVADTRRLTALAILGIRDREQFPLLFYRENCADMALDLADLDEDWIKTAGAVLINGTHLSVPNVYEVSTAAARLVKAAGGKVVFDVDYRPVLWGLADLDMGENRFVAHEAVTRRLQEVLPLCDLIVGTEEEIHILGGSTDTIAALRAIRAATPALIVCKRGALGSSAFQGDIPDDLDGGVCGRRISIEVYNVLGAGDAFMAGFLRGWLRGEDLATCCTFGNACGALVVSRHGCAPAMATWKELCSFLEMRAHAPRLREEAGLEHVHWASTRRKDYPSLTVLAIDHRSQLEDIAGDVGGDLSRISKFKGLALDALDRVAGGNPQFGVLLDGRYGFEALARAADLPYWIGRPIEKPKSRPLEFEGGPDVAIELREWPLNHVVKCLVFYHPDDPLALREQQERQLLRLFDACRATRHELLIEVISPEGLPVDESTVARSIRRIYELGIRPDWWKLEPAKDAATWRNIEAAVQDNDPDCRGILLLGLASPAPQLIESFSGAVACESVKGFAIGRTIFYDVARAWLEDTMDDETATDAMAQRFSLLVDGWQAAREEMERAV